MKKIIVAFFISSQAWSACPLYQYSGNSQLSQEIENICTNISNPVINGAVANTIAMNGGFQLKALTLAQMQSITSPLTGQEYFCSDCSTDAVCVSTGTGKGSFSRVSARTTVCN